MQPDAAGIGVSIPVGFFQALQQGGGYVFGESHRLFQSLSGFFRPCNIDSTCESEGASLVSIPVGFFQALQPMIDRGGSLAGSVSIPVGFFQALQHLRLGPTPNRPAKFQSLSGFFRPCNLGVAGRKARANAWFQSLSGFFRPCNSLLFRMGTSTGFGFNPCRVFSGLATFW